MVNSPFFVAFHDRESPKLPFPIIVVSANLSHSANAEALIFVTLSGISTSTKFSHL